MSLERIRKYAFSYGLHGCCFLCGGPLEVPWVRMDCPRRSLIERVAFHVARRLGMRPRYVDWARSLDGSLPSHAMGSHSDSGADPSNSGGDPSIPGGEDP